MTGGKSVQNWGVSAKEYEVLESEPRLARLRIKDGLMYSFLSLPGGSKPGKLVGELHASGSGKVALHTSTCLRPPGSKEKGFSHSIKKDAGTFTLTPERSVFKFTVDLAPYEQGYIYINVSDEALISHVSGVFVENPAP